MLYNVGKKVLAHAASIKPRTSNTHDLLAATPPITALITTACSKTWGFCFTLHPPTFNAGFGFLLGLSDHFTGEQGALAIALIRTSVTASSTSDSLFRISMII